MTDLDALNRPIRVVVTGGRDYRDLDRAWSELAWLHDRFVVGRLCEGGCPTGADKHARAWRSLEGIAGKSYPADWSQGPSGGPIRNGVMLAAEVPDLVLAFPGDRGTKDCIRQAVGLGRLVWVVDAPAWLPGGAESLVPTKGRAEVTGVQGGLWG